MAGSSGLTASPLRTDLVFNWVFLIELIVCGIVTLFFLFYFNRVFAALVSYGLRAWTWHQYRVYVDIQALQISLLGGRVFLKGVRYHGDNETILIQNGYITWRYWLRNVRELDLGNDSSTEEQESTVKTGIDGGEEGRKPKKKLPCRINVVLNGVEWFVYNRSPAYDAIISGIAGEGEESSHVAHSHEDGTSQHVRLRKKGVLSDRGNAQGSYKESISDSQNSPAHFEEHAKIGTPHVEDKSGRSSAHSQAADPMGNYESHATVESTFLLRFLPLHVECSKAALVLGNENTKSILIAKMDKAEGELDASASTKLDQYRQLVNFRFRHPVIQMQPNDDYKEDQTTTACRIKRGVPGQSDTSTRRGAHSHNFFHRQRKRAWHNLQDLVPYFRSSVESFSSSHDSRSNSPTQGGPNPSSWQGLSRYLDEGEKDDNSRWSSNEYATVTTIADSPKATMSFYWDVPGKVQWRHELSKSTCNTINGDVPPEWGIDLSIEGGIINYGPWADRQRAEIQRVFFPSLCKDASPAKMIEPGEYRVPTQFKLYIELDHETTLRIPIREESKNWKWTKQADTTGTQQSERKRTSNRGRRRKDDKGAPGPEVRPFGWLDIKVGANATVRYVMDMVAGESGFLNKLQLDLPNTEITTSVNHGLLWRSTGNVISCDMSNPLQWNGFRTWNFDIGSRGLELFILREHIFLLTDLVGDWASGPPPEYLTFTPFRYLVNLNLQKFRLYLNVNDSNIINNPADFDDNTFIIIFGESLIADICIPIDTFRPHRNDVSFDVVAKHGGLNLHVPPWNTQATFLNSTEIAQLDTLKLGGKYQYCATTSSSNTDTLILDVYGNGATAQFYGFVIRYYLKVKDNYFGDDIHFRTLEEHQEAIRVKTASSQEDSNVQPHKKNNDLDVILSISADESSVILPANLYSAKNHIRIEIATLAADLRFTNYYMDLNVELSTLAFSLGTENDGRMSIVSATSGTQIFVDGLNISGNRLFGLPPIEPTYVCNWDFGVGAITGECTTEFFVRFLGGAKALAFSFDDDENALPPAAALLLHDVTFLRASVDSIRIWIHVEEAAFLFSTSKITLTFDDWAGSHYSKKLDFQIPNLNFACVDAESASRHRSRTQHPVETHGLVQTTISFGAIQKKLAFVEDRRLQQEHLRRHDQRTHRTAFLLHDYVSTDIDRENVDPPAMCVPPIPLPISCDGGLIQDRLSTSKISSKVSSVRRNRPHTGHKSSFLTASSSSFKSDQSILRPRSFNHEGASTAASRSRSVQAGQSHLRDLSVSTGRQSSFYSAVGEPRGLPPSSVTFSSSYMAPYFPLEAVEPDTKDLPVIDSEAQNGNATRSPRMNLGDIQPDRVGENATHVSFIVEMPYGIKAVLSPKAVGAVADLLSAIQPVGPVDLIDDLQISSMSDIFGMDKKDRTNSEVLDIAVRTPGICLRFLNSPDAHDLSSGWNETHDQYDLSVSQLAVTSRSETTRTLNIDAVQSDRQSSAIHLSLGSAVLTAKERFGDINDPQAAVNAILEDVILWIASGQNTAANLIFNAIEVNTASSKIEYLASLVHRTNVLADRVGETFASRLSQQRNRLQLFTYLVATAGEHATDPLFLTRPAYVLRSAQKHLRTHDSWKVIARLRHMYSILETSAQLDIMSRCVNNAESVPKDSAQRVLASFAQWRSWDFNNLGTCVFMSNVFGISKDGPPISVSEAPKINISFQTELVRLVIDPGPKQNEIALSSLTASASVITTSSPIASSVSPSQHGSDSDTTQNTVLQVFCEEISINLNWELCELAQDILRLYQQSESNIPAPEIPSPITLASPKIKPKQNLQVVIVTEKGSITLDTVNIRSVSISKGLKASVVMKEETVNTNMFNIMLAAEATTSKIQSHSQPLSMYQLRNPSVYLSHESSTVNEIPSNVFKVAANSQELSFIVQQDIVALIEVLDLVIGDEVAQLHRLVTKFPTAKRPASPPNTSLSIVQDPKPINKIYLALFLNMYQIRIPLIQSLTYTISGVIARASLAAQFGSEIVFDFDIKEHSHDVQTTQNDKQQSISLVQMPSTNGRVVSSMSEEENKISVFASVESVELDAAAIHSLLTALNRPEISSVVSDIRDDIKAIQAHIEEIFGPSDSPVTASPPKAGPSLIYDAHLTFAGLDIYANAEPSQDGKTTARLEFNVGCVQLLVANRLEQHGPRYEFPEIHINLHRIMFELSRLNNGILEPCGNLAFAAFLTATSKKNEMGDDVRSFNLTSNGLQINLFAETASSVVDVMGHLQNKIKDIDFTREKQYFKKFRKSKPRITVNDKPKDHDSVTDSTSTIMFASMCTLELLNIQISWLVGNAKKSRVSHSEKENLVLSLKRIHLSTRKENSARLTIEDLQLQMVPSSHDKIQRSLNSALLPEVIFNVGYISGQNTRRLAFQAAGKSLDLRLTSQFIIPAAELQRSIGSAAEMVRVASATWSTSPPLTLPSPTPANKRQPFFGKKRMESLLVDADFAGAVVYLSGKKLAETTQSNQAGSAGRVPQAGRYGQFTHTDTGSSTVLRAPGLAWKVEYKDNGLDDPSLNAEVKVDASTNILYPSVVPLILEISSSVKDIVSEDGKDKKCVPKQPPQKFMNSDDDNILAADPSAVLGRTRLNLGLRICKQEFTLSCQPIARVAASARFDEIYMTINTVRSTEHGHFFAASIAFSGLQASVQHVYSRESTGSFDVESIFLSLMNSKHVSGTSGMSAILKISPMKVLINAKQLQDFLLFREIWVPQEMREGSTTRVSSTDNLQSSTFLVQRYQQVAATGAFPWNATVSIAELDVQLDLGQAIGKSAFIISNFWISSKKTSDWEQNLCLGFDKVGVDSSGRMSGFVALQDFKIRTSIQWPAREKALNQTPLVQGSLGFSQLRVKAAFDYQAFLVADITSFEFLMYNVRNGSQAKGDRLVAILDGEAVQIFCTATTAAQALALYQAFLRLAQEKKSNYETSLSETERYIKRKSVSQPMSPPKTPSMEQKSEKLKSPVSLHTDVIVTLKALNVGAFPSTFSDHQVFKIEALNAQARFAVTMDRGKIHSILGLTLGQLRIGLAGVKQVEAPKSVSDLAVEDVVDSVTGSRGGTILKVPQVEATMQTWQAPGSNHIDYIFKSSFEGKVEVGWNYSRVSFIRSMYATHTKALAQRLGKPLPPSALKITGVPNAEDPQSKEGEQQKITAEVNVPLSKYEYTALEPPIIETPLLQSLGEATPPLEFFGLHRDRLPNLTHQIVIVALLELAGEVEDAYAKILGS
ncbi:Macrophage colony-stimulating factor 1 receptor [Ciborinia camelliae]|nr:Macrophage colony-stimulating factor 1 receptor [Ciborinia camelliae]